MQPGEIFFDRAQQAIFDFLRFRDLLVFLVNGRDFQKRRPKAIEERRRKMFAVYVSWCRDLLVFLTNGREFRGRRPKTSEKRSTKTRKMDGTPNAGKRKKHYFYYTKSTAERKKNANSRETRFHRMASADAKVLEIITYSAFAEFP